MPKTLKIKQYDYKNGFKWEGDEVKRCSKSKANDIELRISKLEAHLNNIFKELNNKFEYDAKDKIFRKVSRNNINQLINIKDYLSNIIYQISKLKSVEESTTVSPNSSESLGTVEQVGVEFNININNTILNNESNIFLLSNRGGRGCEKIGCRSNDLRYGAFLEKGLHAYNCVIFGSSFLFNENEVITAIKNPKPDFVSHAILASFYVPCGQNMGLNFDSISKKAYNDSCKMIYQAYNNINFNTLRGLYLLSILAFYNFDFSFASHLYLTILRMSYVLGIDKIDLSIDTALKSKEEIMQLIKMRKMWISLVLFAFTGSTVLNHVPPTIKEISFDITEFQKIQQLEDQFSTDENNELTSTIRHSSKFRLIAQELMLPIHLRLKPTLYNNDPISLSEIRLPKAEILRIQSGMNKYIRRSTNIVALEIERIKRNKPIILYQHLCDFPGNFCIDHGIYYFLNQSVYIYASQILLLYPPVINKPFPVELPIDEMILLLEVAIHMKVILQVISYIYFEAILLRSEYSSYLPSEVRESIQSYLNSMSRPIIPESLNQDCYTIRTLQLEVFTYALSSFLLILSSQTFQIRTKASSESMNYIRDYIIEILNIFRIISKLPNKDDKIDIDITFNLLSKSVGSFNLPKGFEINWIEYLENFGPIEDLRC